MNLGLRVVNGFPVTRGQKAPPVKIEEAVSLLEINGLSEALPPVLPPDLSEVVESWSDLPGSLRAAILAIVRSAGKEGGT